VLRKTPSIGLVYFSPPRARHGVREKEAGREELEDPARIGLAAGQQGVLRLQPARADLRQHDDRLVRLHLLLWYAVSNSASSLRGHPRKTSPVLVRRPRDRGSQSSIRRFFLGNPARFTARAVHQVEAKLRYRGFVRDIEQMSSVLGRENRVTKQDADPTLSSIQLRGSSCNPPREMAQ